MTALNRIMTLVAGMALAAGATAAGQFGNDGQVNTIVGLYGNDGLGGKLGYTTPITIQGMNRSGLGLVLAAEAGAGISESSLNVGGMIGPDLVFVLNDTMDIYGGIGVGAQFVEEFNIGTGGKIGLNFVANDTSVFLEGGSHPGGLGYLGAGVRF